MKKKIKKSQSQFSNQCEAAIVSQSNRRMFFYSTDIPTFHG